MKHFNPGLVMSLLLVSVTAFVHAAEESAPAKAPQGVFSIKVSIDTLSLDAREAPLAKVFEEIGKQAGITVEGNIGPTETVTMRLDNVPLEEGIKRLSNNVTILYGAKPNDKGHRIMKIVVLSEDKRKVTRSQETKATKPSKRAEPFKFEFDPTKAMKN
jgi:hypothetical protein